MAQRLEGLTARHNKRSHILRHTYTHTRWNNNKTIAFKFYFRKWQDLNLLSSLFEAGSHFIAHDSIVPFPQILKCVSSHLARVLLEHEIWWNIIFSTVLKTSTTPCLVCDGFSVYFFDHDVLFLKLFFFTFLFMSDSIQN